MFTVSHDYYAILGVSKNATPEEIRVRYRKLIKEHHPDQFMGLRAKYKGDEDLLKVIDEKIREAGEKSKLINEAFEVLSDPIKRKQYDEQVVEPSVPLPEISIHPTRIAFGSLLEGQKKSLAFTIENKGGPPVAVNIDWEKDKPDWGELDIEPDAENVFPIKVTVKVDATGIPSGPKDEKILVDVDGRIHMVEVFLAVTRPVVAPATPTRAYPSPPPAPPTKTRFTVLAQWWVAILAVVILIGVSWGVTNDKNERERNTKAYTAAAEQQQQLQEQQRQQQQEEQLHATQVAQIKQEISSLVKVDNVRRMRCEDIPGNVRRPYGCPQLPYTTTIFVVFTVTNNSSITVWMRYYDEVGVYNAAWTVEQIEPGQTKEFAEDDGRTTISSQLCLRFWESKENCLYGDVGEIGPITICEDIPKELASQ